MLIVDSQVHIWGADAPNFERYDEKFDPSTGDGGLEIWIPVKE